MMKLAATGLVLALVSSALAADRTPAPEGAVVYFIAPADGETVTGPRRDLEELLDHLLDTSEANTGDDTCIVGVQLT